MNLLPAERERAERERVERTRPHLAFTRADPITMTKAVRDPFAWADLAVLLPVESSDE